ncbi:membrane protein insertion efficiency factor YidD [candidate division WWE3 bacterium]|jgi:putative membrane protein insertion efficiency factor|uniref:Putative membrane protein insertion efficiency factor n=1 Tax=candidate division WWE3 bacterium TaxID=2053526 RepID=A0A3A4ZCK4_UNCKA|nr:MAG: membrane protein insertion efficiency factor YidD [candidate division WWE3 bacterium]
MRKLALTLIKLYKKFLSPVNFGIHTCRFVPSCSDYTYEAIEKYGVLKGSIMGGYRILRCNPLSEGGFDPVE